MTRHRSFDASFPPNETPERIARWESATAVESIPAGVPYLEKWSNGHYSEALTSSVEALPSDNTGIPLRHCERRVLNSPPEGDGHPAEASAESLIRDEIRYRIRTAIALGRAEAKGTEVADDAADTETESAMNRIADILNRGEKMSQNNSTIAARVNAGVRAGVRALVAHREGWSDDTRTDTEDLDYRIYEIGVNNPEELDALRAEVRAVLIAGDEAVAR